MKSFGIGKKLYFGVAALLAIVAGLAAAAYLSLSGAESHVHLLATDRIYKHTLIHGMDRDAALLAAASSGTLMHGAQTDPAGAAQMRKEFGGAAADLQRDIDTLTPLLTRAVSKAALKQIAADLHSELAAQQAIAHALASGDEDAAYAVYRDSLRPVQLRQRETIRKMLDLQAENLANDVAVSEQSAARGRAVDLALVALALVAGAGLVLLVRQVNAVLRAAVESLSESAAQIAVAADDVSRSSQAVAQAAAEQAATIQETSSASVEIRSMAHSNSESAEATAALTAAAQVRFEKTGADLIETVSAMSGLADSSAKIGTILKVIDQIAFQTNLLALNASVEDTSLRSADAGVKVDRTANSIRLAAAESANIRQLVERIKLGGGEQTCGIDQIAASIGQMERATIDTAANAEKSASSAAQLHASAETMHHLVAGIRVLVEGAPALAASPRNRLASRPPLPPPSSSMMGAASHG